MLHSSTLALAILSLSQLPPYTLGDNSLLTLHIELSPSSSKGDIRLRDCISKAIPETKIPEGVWVFHLAKGKVSKGEEVEAPLFLPCLQKQAVRRTGKVMVSILRSSKDKVERSQAAPSFESPTTNSHDYSKFGRAVPAFQNGKRIGYRLFQIAPGSVFQQIGLEDGDVITKIDNKEITDSDNFFELFQGLNSKKNFSIDFLRNEEPIRYNFSLR